MNKFLQQILQSFCYAFYFLKEIRNLIVSREVHTVWLQFLEIFGKIGVDLFILITSYFALNPRPTFQKSLATNQHGAVLRVRVICHFTGVWAVAI